MRRAFLINLAITLIFASVCSAEFQVNTHTTWDQKDAAVAMDEQGVFVVVWNSYRQDGDSGGIFGQRFSATGGPLGSESQINTTTSGNQASPTVAMDAAGNFIVVWQGPGLSDEDIFAQRFDPNGKPLGAEFQVNSYADSQQLCPAVAMNVGGQFVAVWESQNIPQDPNKTSICGQLYDASGSTIGPEFTVNSQLATCRYPGVAMDSDGNFAVVWMKEASKNSIVARLYNADGSAGTEPFAVNTISFNSITQPSVAMDGSGHFVVAWDGDPNRAGDDDIHARLFEPDGTPVGDQFIVNTTLAGAQQNPRVAINSASEFVIVWNSQIGPETSERDIFGQRFDSSGGPIGDEFQVNSYVTGDQRNPAVAMGQIGQFVAVWQSDGQDGSRYGIFGQIGPVIGSADCNSDGIVNFRDYCTLAAEWQKNQNPLRADLIDDNKIDEQDLAVFCDQWLAGQAK
jgi:hypothetical protein